MTSVPTLQGIALLEQPESVPPTDSRPLAAIREIGDASVRPGEVRTIALRTLLHLFHCNQASRGTA